MEQDLRRVASQGCDRMVGQVVGQLKGRPRQENNQQDEKDHHKSKENPPNGVVLHLFMLTFFHLRFASASQATEWHPCVLLVHAESIREPKDHCDRGSCPI